jgi:YHS domain-containing protein
MMLWLVRGAVRGVFVMRGLLVGLSLSLLASAASAETSINVIGSDDRTAISGYDPVGFIVQQKALVGNPQFAHEHAGAKWLFSSAENLKAFQAEPDKYLPAWGGHCAWEVSEGGVSTKKLSGAFAVLDGKTYLFSYGNRAKDGPKDDFLYGRVPLHIRLTEGNKHWSSIKPELESGVRLQPIAWNYVRSRFE